MPPCSPHSRSSAAAEEAAAPLGWRLAISSGSFPSRTCSSSTSDKRRYPSRARRRLELFERDKIHGAHQSECAYDPETGPESSDLPPQVFLYRASPRLHLAQASAASAPYVAIISSRKSTSPPALTLSHPSQSPKLFLTQGRQHWRLVRCAPGTSPENPIRMTVRLLAKVAKM